MCGCISWTVAHYYNAFINMMASPGAKFTDHLSCMLSEYLEGSAHLVSADASCALRFHVLIKQELPFVKVSN